MSNIITMKTFIDPRVINIFTDASVYQNGNEFISSHGFYCPTTNESFSQVVRMSSNNKGELMGIRDGILYAISKRSEYQQINIWSDSLYSVKSICEWFPKWYMNSVNGVLYNNNNKEINNQNILNEIITLILSNNLRVNIIHQRGHIIEKVKMSDAIKSFKIANNMMITEDAMFNAATCNQIIDELTRNQFLTKNILDIPIYKCPMNLLFLNIDVKRLLILTRKTGDLE